VSAIAGLWRFDERPGVGADCERMLAAQRIYGPDDGRQWTDGPIAMGRRLFRLLPEDIADRQPLVGRDGRLVLGADVRLDNRDELIAALGLPAEARRACDAEILLACLDSWDEAALDRIVGDFAFALWDAGRQRLLLARDFLGQRPLHYHCGKDFFAFATMAKGLHALADIPYAADEQTVAELVTLLPQSGPRSFFEHICRVEPGHVVTATREGVSSRCYWQPRRPGRGDRAPADWVEGVRHHLDEATRARLRGADGAVATHLSGGLDSSAVTATAARLLAPEGVRVTAFTSVPSQDASAAPMPNRIVDEGPLAAATAALYPNVEHVRLRTGHMSPFDSLDQIFFLFERPKLNLCNWVWLRAINQEAKDRRIKVVLDAAMGNMTFSYFGYQLMPELLRTGRWIRLLREYRGLMREGGMSWRGPAGVTFGPYVPSWLWNRLTDGFQGGRYDIHHYSAINRQRFEALNLDGIAKERKLDFSYRPRKDGFADRVWVLRRIDPGNTMKGTLAGWGVDQRDPTADRRLVEYCLSIPTDRYLVNGVSRAVARQALRDRLPPEVLAERRRGYQAADWHVGLAEGRSAAATELDQLAACESAARTLDVGRMKRLLDDLPTSGWEKPGQMRAYRLALLRGMAAGHFLRKASGSNG
jgi:asparagine synthase (glutamine-hydrolysing)